MAGKSLGYFSQRRSQVDRAHPTPPQPERLCCKTTPPSNSLTCPRASRIAAALPRRGLAETKFAMPHWPWRCGPPRPLGKMGALGRGGSRRRFMRP